jgi:hypothetical protein
VSVVANQSLVIGGNEVNHWIIGPAAPPPPGAAPALKKLSILRILNDDAVSHHIADD